MAGAVLTTAAAVRCAHGGPATVQALQSRVLASGVPVTTIADPWVVHGCPLHGSGPACLAVQWVTASTRVLVGGVPAVVRTGSGIGLPGGSPVIVAASQSRVHAQ